MNTAKPDVGMEVQMDARPGKSTPTGLHQSAPGCEARATLGEPAECSPTLKGLQHLASFGRTVLPWLQPRWGWVSCSTLTQGSAGRAAGLNDTIPLGLGEIRPGLVGQGCIPKSQAFRLVRALEKCHTDNFPRKL